MDAVDEELVFVDNSGDFARSDGIDKHSEAASRRKDADARTAPFGGFARDFFPFGQVVIDKAAIVCRAKNQPRCRSRCTQDSSRKMRA